MMVSSIRKILSLVWKSNLLAILAEKRKKSSSIVKNCQFLGLQPDVEPVDRQWTVWYPNGRICMHSGKAAQGRRCVMKKLAVVDRKVCVACGVCMKACPKGAISVYKGCYAMVEEAKCVGCGLCAKACPAGCIETKERSEAK